MTLQSWRAEISLQRREGGIFKNKHRRLWGTQGVVQKLTLLRKEDLGRWWQTAASKQVKEEEHKIDFDSMKDRNGVYREKSG